MASHTQLKSLPHVGDALLSDQLETNLSGYLSWAFLGAGGFFTVRKGAEGCFGGDQSRLRPVTDPNYTDGQVWEAFRKDWVWESGVEYDAQPVRTSGVYVNNTFLPLASGVTVDYPNGRVILPSPVPQSSVVQAEYTYRLFQVYTADYPAWQKFQPGSFRADDSHFLQAGSGAWDVLAQNRIQLPAVVVEAVPRTSRYGSQIGGGDVVNQDVVFHVVAEERWHYKWLHDALSAQWQQRLRGFDKNRLLRLDAFPLDENGSPRASGLMYPDLVKPTGEGGHYWEQIRFEDVRSQDQPRAGSLWYCTVRATMQVDRPD